MFHLIQESKIRPMKIILGVKILLIVSLLFYACETKEEKAARENKEQIEALAETMKREAEDEKNRIKDLYGDEIQIAATTVGNEDNPLVKGENSNLWNLKCYIHRQRGILTISFNFRYDRKSKFPLLPQRKFLVRLFDVNGQYINHFETAERYTTTSEFDYAEKQSGGRMKFVRLKKMDNLLQYPINLRDANYISFVEFGMN